MLQRSFNIAVALLAFAASCAVLHRVIPAPPVENVTPKLSFFAAHRNDFDTLFIGTSRLQHHISPALFDATTSAGGRATHSFNFGVDGMHPAESFFVIEQILALAPRNLRQVFIEFEGVQSDWWRAGGPTRRLAYWHDWKQTSLTIAKTIDPRGNAPWFAEVFRAIVRRRTIVMHLGLFVRQSANVGRLFDLVANWNANERPDWKAQLGPAHNGYQEPLAPMPPERVPRYTKKLQRELGAARPHYVDPYAERAYREYAGRFAQLGARSFFVITPVATQSSLHFRPPPPGPVFRFNSVKKYPQLYDPAVRADEGHMSQVGADEFTRLLAQRFVAAATR